MSDFLSMISGGADLPAPSTSDRKTAYERAQKTMGRIRERHEFIYRILNQMDGEQLKAIHLMLSSCQEDEIQDAQQQISFYKGWISGIVGYSRDEFLIFPDDVFPHFEEEDDAEFLEKISELDSEEKESEDSPGEPGHYL